MKTELLSRARAAGFSDARITRAELPAHYGDRLREWVAAGMHGEMEYMERTAEMRAQGADAVLPGAQSVIVFAASYYPGNSRADTDLSDIDSSTISDPTLRIAKYALGEDYHLVFRERLQPVVEWLNETVPGHTWRICVDSAPLNERAYAIESGIGFMGRNTMIIAPDAGSYLLLAEIVTTAQLPTDAPISGTCGTCTRCIDACPTGAITEPLRVDATRCISYLTIEKKTELSAAEHDACGEWAFGCDICQDVCPYNKSPEPVAIPELAEGVRVHRNEPASTFLQLLSNRQFERRLNRSPLLRAGKRRLQKRVAAIENFTTEAQRHRAGTEGKCLNEQTTDVELAKPVESPSL
ncbi:MAG: tRNA epoxyqueuosine(34) reductase QueG [Candidatus Sumerlaeaceae bacterium]